MDRVSIIVPDERVIVDGASRRVPGLAGMLPNGLHAVQVVGYDGPAEDLEIAPEWAREGSKPTKRAKLAKSQIAPAIAGWRDAAPPVRPTPTLAEVKTSARQRVDQWRLQTEESGFTYNGKRFQSDERSAHRIVGAMTMARLAHDAHLADPDANAPYSQDWVAEDNTSMTLDNSGMTGLFAALSQHVKTTFATAQQAKKAIVAAATIEAVQKVLDGLPSR